MIYCMCFHSLDGNRPQPTPEEPSLRGYMLMITHLHIDFVLPTEVMHMHVYAMHISHSTTLITLLVLYRCAPNNIDYK